MTSGIAGKALFLAAALVFSGCMSEPAPAGQREVAPAPSQPKTMVMVVITEPASLASVPLLATGLSTRSVTRLFNAGLAIEDPLNTPHPYLAEAVPQLNTDAWQVFPDGRMETRYRLRPGLVWQDGVPFSAEDFVFAREVYATPEFGVAGLPPLAQMEEVLAPDPRTVVIRWRKPYPDAGNLYETFPPLPRHLLDQSFTERNQDAFVNNRYWSTEYVGLGPYRLTNWEPGAFVEGEAFDGHALGRPKIDRVVIRIIAEENTILTNLLTESIHVSASQTLSYEQAVQLKGVWTASQRGTVVLIPIQPRFIHVQLRPELVSPRALLDVRARRALAHSIDKPGLDEGLFGGQGAVTDTFLHRRLPYYADIDRAATKYPYDLQRAEQLMGDLGFSKGGDGVYAGDNGERFAPEFWGDVGAQFEGDLNAVAAGWRRAGIETRASFVPLVQLRNGEFRMGFTGLYFTTTGFGTEQTLVMWTSGSIPSPASRFAGTNRGGWSNAQFDRLWDAFNTTLDRSERNRQAVEMERILTDQLPFLMLFHNFNVVTILANVQGPDTRGLRDHVVWNVHEWVMR